MERDLIQLKITDDDLEILRKIYGPENIRDFLQFKKAVVTFCFYRGPIPVGAPDYKELFNDLVGVVKCFKKDIEKFKSGAQVVAGDIVDF